MTNRHFEKSLERFLNRPVAAGDSANPKFIIRRLRSSTHERLEDLWDVVYLSHRNKRIQLANPELTPIKRFHLYRSWIDANLDTILVLERKPADANGVSVIGCSIVLPLRLDDFVHIERGAMAVINLLGKQICKRGEAFDVMLFDTWVMHFDYQQYGARFWTRKRTHFGWANALPMRHIALLWNTGRRVLLVAEPDSKSMQALLQRVCFSHRSKSLIGEPLLSIELPPQGGPGRSALDALGARLREYADWPLA